jgi:hypothetical protein
MPAETLRALLPQKLKSFPANLDIGDVVVLLYISAFVRQWLWPIPSNSLGWILTFLFSVVIWVLHLATKDRDPQKPLREFWLIVALPLFLIYAMRAAFPDTSFDLLDYRLINSERALHGLPLIAGDFFPTRFPFNPAPDMVTGISRHLLGYRLGTIVNYLVVVWVGTLLVKFLRPYVNRGWLLCAGVLTVLLTEHLLFIVNNYMVDLLALPLLLEATRIALDDEKRSSADSIRLAIFLGASAAFKLTNLAFAVPILVIHLYKLSRGAPRVTWLKNVLVIGCCFLLPLIPYTLYISWHTGNPVFPLFNKLFRSPYWPTNDLGVRWGPVVDDPRWLHMRWWEVLLWPLLLPFKIEHTAGDLGPHAGRISVAFIAAIASVTLKRIDRRLRLMGLILVVGALLWSMLSGMLRYATYLELIGGLLVLALTAQLFQSRQNEARSQIFRRVAALALCAVLVSQAAIAVGYVYRFEWSSRPTVFEQPDAFLNDSKFFMRDYSLPGFLSARERALIAPVTAWAETSALESGIEVQLNSNAPAVCLYMPEYFATAESRARFAHALDQLGDRKIYSLCYAEHFRDAIASIRNSGLTTGQITPFVLPYYSDYTRINMALIEVRQPREGIPARQISISHAIGPLADELMKAELSFSPAPPTVLRAGLKETIYVKLRNLGNGTWPALAKPDGSYRLSMGNHWLDENNKPLVHDDGRSTLLYDLAPGEEIELPLTVIAPAQPGNYVLEIDVVQEGVAWFASKNSKPLRTILTVN